MVQADCMLNSSLTSPHLSLGFICRASRSIRWCVEAHEFQSAHDDLYVRGFNRSKKEGGGKRRKKEEDMWSSIHTLLSQIRKSNCIINFSLQSFCAFALSPLGEWGSFKTRTPNARIVLGPFPLWHVDGERGYAGKKYFFLVNMNARHGTRLKSKPHSVEATWVYVGIHERFLSSLPWLMARDLTHSRATSCGSAGLLFMTN